MNWKLSIGILIFLIAAGLLIYNSTFNKSHLDVSEADIDFELSLTELFDEFSVDEIAAYKKYSEKVVLIQGNYNSMTSGEFDNLLLTDENGRIANCEMENEIVVEFSPGQRVKLKGLFIGYDDLMGELQFKKCSLIE